MPRILTQFVRRAGCHSGRDRRLRRGFTLIELMISIAIVLILMLGINYVFSTSSKTIGTGLALSAVSRDMRNARSVMQSDFDNAKTVEDAGKMPAIIIESQTIPAFLNKKDRLSDYDYSPADIDPQRTQHILSYDVDGKSGDEVNATLTSPNFRAHRVDRISFFVSSNDQDFARQTGEGIETGKPSSTPSYIGSETSPEAWVWYGMLRQVAQENPPFPAPFKNPTYAKPGVGTDQTNPNNFYASQWIFGRHLMLLKKLPVGTTGTSFTGNPGGTAVQALAYGQNANIKHAIASDGGPYGTANAAWQIQESRVDLACTSIADALAAIPPAGAFGSTFWWVDADAGAARDIVDFTTPASTAQPTLNYLFWAKPFLSKTGFAGGANPLANQTREAALTTPIFLRGCTQCIIEFAGDFFEQSLGEPLGTVDYDILDANGSKRIHWYGADRELDGVAGINPNTDISGVEAFATAPKPFPADTRVRRYPTLGVGKTFEQQIPSTATSATTPQSWIWAWGPAAKGKGPVAGNVLPPSAGTPATDPYAVRPSMIRITLELIDANGRLQDGQKMQFVFNLK